MRYLTILSILGLLLSLPLQAAETQGLYEAEVEVSEQGASARATGMREAMRAVLLKVSGSSRVIEDSGLAEAMESPSRYVQQYRYRTDSTRGTQNGRLLLQVSFDQKSIDGLLRTHGFNIWGDARPSTLIWLAVEDHGSRVLVGANDGGLVRDLIGREAERRALPVKLPQLDFTDKNRVTTTDVWGEFLDPIRKASQRYEAQAILVGRLYPLSSSRWEARWALAYRGEVQRWQGQDGNVSALISGAVGRVSDLLAQSFADSFAAGSGELLIRIDDVRTLKDYHRSVDYLKGMHGVRQVVTEALSSDKVILRLTIEGGREAVLRVIALGKTLERLVLPQMRYSPAGGERTPQQDMPPGAAYTGGLSAMSSGTGVSGAAAENPDVQEIAVQPTRLDMAFRLLP